MTTYDASALETKSQGADVQAALSPAAVYIVQGEHPTTPGRRMSAHSSEPAARQQAADLVNVILLDLDLMADATPDNWESRLEVCRGGGDTGLSSLVCDVWIDRLDLDPPRDIVA